jgi:methyl-accepting chemotaxis protein
MRISIKVTLLTVLATLGFLLLVNSFSGYRALNATHERITDLYGDRVVPSLYLKTISDAYAVFVVDASHKVRNGNFTWAEGLESLAKARADVTRNWADYLALGHEEQAEQATIAKAKQQMAAADKTVDELEAAFKSQSAPTLDALVKERLYQSIDPLTETIAMIAQEEVKGAQHVFLKAQADHAQAALFAKVLSVLGLIALALGSWAILSRVAAPLGRLTAALRLLGQDRYEVAVPCLSQGDEMGTMARAVEALKRRGAEAASLRQAQEAQRRQAARAKREALDGMARTVERESGLAVDAVAARTHEMDDHAQAMAHSAEHVCADSQTVAAAAQQALHNAENVSSATEEMTASIHEIARRVERASVVSSEAVEKSVETQRTIASLSDAVGRIGDVARLIGEIAAQTNLLALNATIEAARAGEAGKGFAVVANEVKNLATQTSRSTEEISRQINEINTVTHRAVGAVSDIGRTIEEMDRIAGDVSAAIEQQGAAAQEISRNVAQAADAAREVSGRIAEVLTEAGQTVRRAETVRLTAEQVASGMSELRTALVSVVQDAVARASEEDVAA